MNPDEEPSAPLPAIVLAAGESRRMGRLKPLLPLGSKTVLQRVVDSLDRAGATPIRVVVGHRAEEIRDSLKGRPVECVVNPNYLSGMLSSVQRGIRSVPPDAPACLLALGDQPDVPPDVIRQLYREWRAQPGSIVVPRFEGRRGHPILIDRLYFPRISGLDETQTLRDVVLESVTLRIETPVQSEGPLLDLDTPEDYALALCSGRFTD